MCGIFGSMLFEGSPARIDRAEFIKLRDTLAHRGPDHAGLWISANQRVALAHRRLAITDLAAAANQPMCNEDQTIWITYNGQIYNHQALRQELLSLGGHQWQTDHSDTEVILHAYETWGRDCLQKFRGMFAFALWDERIHELWLVRDRIGIKPLYYTIQQGQFRFASEIKTLLADPQLPRHLNEQSLYHYLRMGITAAPATMFAGIINIPPGTWLRVTSAGNTFATKYWDVWDHTRPRGNLSDDQLALEVADCLRQTIKLHAISDLPLGSFLSGGLDSSLIAALYTQLQQKPLPTFTIGYDQNYCGYPNELVQARLVADQIKAVPHERLLSWDDLLENLSAMQQACDEPLGNPTSFPLHLLASMARDQGMAVVQDGEGSDEIFFGYSWYFRALHQEKLYQSVLEKQGLKRFNSTTRLFLQGGSYSLYRKAAAGQPLFWGSREQFSESRVRTILSRRMARLFSNYSIWELIQPIYRHYQATAWEKSPENWCSYLDLRLQVPELLLHRLDRLTMFHSLECRVPFFDHQLVEMAFSIPAAAKIRNGIPKAILKSAARGLLPDSIIDRPKQGLNVPLAQMLTNNTKRKIKDQVLAFSRQTDYFNARAIARLDETHDVTKLWYLYGFCRWYQQYFS